MIIYCSLEIILNEPGFLTKIMNIFSENKDDECCSKQINKNLTASGVKKIPVESQEQESSLFMSAKSVNYNITSISDLDIAFIVEYPEKFNSKSAFDIVNHEQMMNFATVIHLSSTTFASNYQLEPEFKNNQKKKIENFNLVKN